MSSPSIPVIPPVPMGLDPQLAPFLSAIRESVLVRAGQTKNYLDHSPTVRELIDSGVVTLSRGSVQAFGPPIDLDSNGDPTIVIDPSTKPPVITGFSASTTPWTVILIWNDHSELYRQLISNAEVWFNPTVDSSSDAGTVMLGTANVSFVHAVEPLHQGYYWVRWVSHEGVPGDFQAVNGEFVQTSQDATSLLALLNQELSESELTGLLNGRIDLIDVSGSVGGSGLISAVQTLDTESGSQATAVLQLQTDVSTINGTLSSHATSINQVTTTANNNTSSVSSNLTSINGIQGKYSVKIDVNGHVSGFGLISTANDGVVVSEMQIAVDKFSIRSPIATELVFAVAGGKVVMDGAYIKDATIDTIHVSAGAITNVQIANSTLVASLFADGQITGSRMVNSTITGSKIAGSTITASNLANVTITGSKIVDSTLTAVKIGDDEITIPVGSYSVTGVTSTNNTTNVQAATVSMDSAGQPVFISFSCIKTRTSGNDANYWVGVYRGGTALIAMHDMKSIDQDESQAINISIMDTAPPTGTNNYYVYVRSGDSNDTNTWTYVSLAGIGLRT